MKKLMYFAAAIMMLAVCSCQKEADYSAAFDGTWKVSKVNSSSAQLDGVSMTLDTLASKLKQLSSLFSVEKETFTITDENSILYFERGDGATCTVYMVDDDAAAGEKGEKIGTGTISGNTLTMNLSELSNSIKEESSGFVNSTTGTWTFTATSLTTMTTDIDLAMTAKSLLISHTIKLKMNSSLVPVSSK